eukprot:TRINITY_DN540_c0_g1_i1.p1 TRINITY_DN540_c0_g1~~TRINITY_DN540_c0_g1_i1.p1  ORF type:complete len:785 (-),score=347.92 TRINITY_DN540_c0_g1_i1:89-2443(-)
MVRQSNMKLLVAAAACGVASAGSSSQQGRLTMNTVAARQKMLEEAWAKDLDGKGSPVQRVVGLLEKMKAELEKEAKSEAEMYDKMVCWCETNEKEKTKAISDAEVKTDDLSAETQERAAKFGELETQIAALKKQITADKGALATATAIREKEAAAFSEEEKSAMQAVTNLKNAVDVLAKHNGGAAGSASLVQMDSAVMASVRAVLRDVSFKYELMMGDRPLNAAKSTPGSSAFLSVTQGKDLVSALRGAIGNGHSVMPADIAAHALARAAGEAAKSAGSFVQAPGYQSYSSQSSGIFGILKQMKEEFEEKLSESQKDEMRAVADFKEMAAAKSAQIETAQKKLDEVEGAHADNQKALSDAKEDLEMTRGQRTDDVEFLQNLRLTCKDLDSQWQERSHTRSAEITAVAEALVILREDDNREHLAKTVSLMQVGSVQNSDAAVKQRRIRAAAALRKAAAAGLRKLPGAAGDDDDLLAAWQGMRAVGNGSGGPHAQLATLAVSVELDGFTEVKKVMDKMIADLKEQQKEEVEHKAYCGKELNQNEKDTFNKNEEKQDLEAKIESLGASIDSLNDEIKGAGTEIADTQKAIKVASEGREKENAEFQTVVADQRATQGILTKALNKLKDFYEKNLGAEQLAGSSLLQQKQTPPVQFNDYKKNAGSNSVIGLIEQIIQDSTSLEKDAIASETEAQSAYEDFIKSSNKVVSDAQQSIATKTETVAQFKMESETAQADHTSAVGELEALATYKADLHSECDFLLKNFDIRQRARQQEIDSIQEAKSILSGMQ